MPAVVVNHLHFSALVDELAATIAERFPRTFDALPGFHAFYFVKEADDRAAFITIWDDEGSAAAGSAALGRTLDELVVPWLAGPQERTVGPALVAHHRHHPE